MHGRAPRYGPGVSRGWRTWTLGRLAVTAAVLGVVSIVRFGSSPWGVPTGVVALVLAGVAATAAVLSSRRARTAPSAASDDRRQAGFGTCVGFGALLLGFGALSAWRALILDATRGPIDRGFDAVLVVVCLVGVVVCAVGAVQARRRGA